MMRFTIPALVVTLASILASVWFLVDAQRSQLKINAALIQRNDTQDQINAELMKQVKLLSERGTPAGHITMEYR